MSHDLVSVEQREPSTHRGAASGAAPGGPRRWVKLVLAYRGTDYAGWAVQPPHQTAGRPTLQATVAAALSGALGHVEHLTAAGRTDRGVHADAQVVSFETTSRVPARAIARLLDRALPNDVWVVDATESAPGFDARRRALRRWYRYAIWRTGRPGPAWHGRCLVHAEPLDLGAMRQASRALLGRHDLATFASQPPPGKSTVRTIFAADWLERDAALLLFDIGADAFLKQMVRGIVGSLLWVGTGHWRPDQFEQALNSCDRRAGGPNAPAAGLSLYRIEYPQETYAYLTEDL